jgi:hypothetical protein
MTCKGDAASCQLKPSFTGIQTTIHHLIATGRQRGEVEVAIRPKFCFLGGSRCWAIKPAKGRDPPLPLTCSLCNSQLLPDASLLILHRSLGCINGGSNRTYTPPCDNDILESWQYICARYRKQPGCAWRSFQYWPCSWYRALRPLGVSGVPLGWLRHQRVLGQKLVQKDQAGRTVRTFSLTQPQRGGGALKTMFITASGLYSWTSLVPSTKSP